MINIFSLFDKEMMNRCLQLAKNGFGTTYPNPLVGCVITHNNIIIGEGWHQKSGLPHAEINAINSVKDKSLLKESTLYVNLEPCVHFGKTPPCANAIIENNIPKVVIGHIDYSSKVNGKGIEKLRNYSIEVKDNCLEKETYDINKRFFTYHKKNRSYIILKWAETNNGFIGKEKERIWISNSYAKQVVHKWRTEEQAILVGKNTVLIDNPKLNAREYVGNNSVRIIVDKELAVSKKMNVLDNRIKTIVFNEKKDEIELNTTYITLDFNEKDGIPALIDELYKQEIQSIIIEGGAFTLNKFIEYGFWDEARVFIATNVEIENGITAPKLKNHQLVSAKNIDNNILYQYINQSMV